MKKFEVIKLKNHDEIFGNINFLNDVQKNIKNGVIYIIENYVEKTLIEKIIKYLQQVGSSSLPNYYPIELGSKNTHRINNWDERSYVKGCFHQFVFYPWNQDYFNLFEKFRTIFQAKNLISGNEINKFLSDKIELECIPRLAFQFYPKSIGGLNRHRDPVDFHQLTVPIMTMTQKGIDFKVGGAFVENEQGEKLYIDDITKPGDIVYFNANMIHGVDIIDPQSNENWLNFEGRWILLFAINKISSNINISNAIDLD